MSIYKRGNIYWATIHSKLGGQNRRLQISTSTHTKGVATTFEQKLVRLHDYAIAGAPVPPDLLSFVRGLTEQQLKKLSDYGLVPSTLVSMALSLDKHLEDFLLDCRDESPDTVKIKRADILKAARSIGATRLIDLTPDRLRPYFVGMEKCQSARSRNRIRSAIMVFLKWAVEHGRLHEHKIHLIPRANEKKDKRRAKRALTDQELTALLNAVPDHRATKYFFVVRTGLRRKETRGVLWRDIDLDAATLEVFAKRTKTCKPDIIPLPRQLVDRLKVLASQRCDPDQPVFDNLPTARTVNRDLERAGIPKRDANGLQVDLHALKTTYTTSLLRTGATASEAKHATRHVSTNVLETHYNRLNLEDTRKMVERLPEINFEGEQSSGQESEDVVNVAEDVAREPLEPAPTSSDWLNEGTKALLAFCACSFVVNRYNSLSCTDRQQGAPIDIKDVCKSFSEKDLRAISSAG